MTQFRPVAELLPHSGEMVLLDEVVSSEAQRTVCRVRIRHDALFVEDGAVPAVVAIEYMAQTIGAFAGLRARAVGGPPRIGYLLGTRELTLDVDRFEIGDELLVEAVHVFGDEVLGSFQCAVFLGERCVARALLNTYQSPDKEPPP